MAKIVKLVMLLCKRCDHEWTPRVPNPKWCPECNSPYWNKDRKNEADEN